MKYFLSSIFILLALQTFSQNNEAHFIFSLIDSNKTDINSSIIKVSAFPILNKELLKNAPLKIRYESIQNKFMLDIPETYSGNIIQIQLVRQTGTFLETMNIYYKSSKENDFSTGCHACVCNEILYEAGNYVVDMPMQAASWALIPNIVIENNGSSITLKDISILQNWREQKLK